MTIPADRREPTARATPPAGTGGKPPAAPQASAKPQERKGGGPAKPKVVQFPTMSQPDIAEAEVPFWRRNWLITSAIALCALPTLLISLYLIFLASDRYAVEVQFAVRSQDSSFVDASGVLGALGGAPPQTTTDSYMVADYLLSSDFVAALQERVNIRELYSIPEIDFFSKITKREELEHTADYWQSMTDVFFDSTKGTVELEVTAFRAEDAHLIAQHAVELAGELVNRISEESRNDALKSALADVERAEFRVRVLRKAMQEFRERERIADPVSSAGSAQELIASLTGELSRIDAEIASVSTFLSGDAPSMVVLKSRRESVEKQLAQARAQIAGTSSVPGGDVARMLSGFEELEVERQFALQAYTTALASLEAARAEADRNQRYLAVFVQPRVPQTAKYPEVLKVILTAFVFLFLGWVIAVLVYYGIREHTV